MLFTAVEERFRFCDVGLLCRACGMDVVKGILSDRLGVNHGSVYENAVAQELKAHGHDLQISLTSIFRLIH